MKKYLLPFYCEARLLLYDAQKLVSVVGWILKKSMTPVVLFFIFWVAFRTIQGITK